MNFRFGNNGNAEVNVATAAVGSMDIFLNALGTVTPQNSVNVYSLVSGRVLSVNYREGQMVEKGQLLAEIDSQPYDAQLKQAEGTMKRDQASLEQARVDLKRLSGCFEGKRPRPADRLRPGQTVKQYEGSVQNDEGAIEYEQDPAWLLPHHRAHRRAHRPAPDRSRQYDFFGLVEHYCRHHATASHHGGLLDSRGPACSRCRSAWPRERP